MDMPSPASRPPPRPAPRRADRARTAVLLALGLSWPFRPAAAWDDLGHMTIAAAAWPQLTPGARSRTMALLALNPDAERWRARAIRGRVPVPEDVTMFMLAATWPDAIKHQRGYFDAGRGGGAAAEEVIGYQDSAQHRDWHYIDLPWAEPGSPSRPPEAPNLLTQVERMRGVLASGTASVERRSYALVWLMHLVGDAHQPLHAVSHFGPAMLAGDAGGNRVTLCERRCESLHAFWDQLPGRGSNPRQALERAARLPAPDPRLAARTDVRAWLDESNALARTAVYVAPVGLGAGPYSGDEAYYGRSRATARDQMALAAARLAGLLNAALR